uniref:Uncharacterized protein n=1 Tax=Arundo donax TaxID=35708 RepID=A0A0A9ECJ3_ARUDO
MPQPPSSSSLPPRRPSSAAVASLRFAGSSGISKNLFSGEWSSMAATR